MTNKEAAQPELSDVAVSAMAVEEMLKDLLPKRGMWEIEGDEAKTAICEVIRDALEGLWKLPFVKTNSKESSLTQKELDTISRHTAIEKLKRRKKIFCENRIEFWILPENDKSRVDEIDVCIEMLMNLPSAQPDVPDTNVGDIISRQSAIDIEGLDEQIRCEMCRNPMHTNRGCDGNCKYDEKLYERIMQILDERIKPLPSAQSEQRWIPVSERLPEPRVDVWVNSDIGQIQGYYEEHINVWYASFGQGRDYLELIVNAWMPLPESYSGE